MPIPAGVPLPRSLLRDDVYVRLRDAIVDGRFTPGEQLRDGDLAQWLGVSRTPVREALLRLAQAGLVVAAPGRSTTVSTLDARAAFAPPALQSVTRDFAFLVPGELAADALVRAIRGADKAAIAGARVSTPLTWDEVSFSLDPAVFTMFTVPERVLAHGDPLADMLAQKADVARAVERLGKLL